MSDLEKLVYDKEFKMWLRTNNCKTRRLRAINAFNGNKEPVSQDSLFKEFLTDLNYRLRR